ncbi:MAG: DNA mismatch repair endonuclease MutL [Alphaproteobacteria bacterium]|jgi:DNA mismatch repair protein MutL|nr:DNA mismatch repair endonuclease MutL [Alphaproteobacteria bacterium]
MGIIKKLSEGLVNRIAAGEVVEKPASVIKELVENSIDANATEITVITKDGGKTYISITDNGKGMSKEDLELSIERHATSKLPNDDLFDIHTFGFRGEALASISSVAKVRISTNNKKESWELNIEGGKNKTIKPSAITQGTKIEVSDLFFATPARLKFLKTDRSENSAIIETLQRLAISHPNVSINYNNKIKFLNTNKENKEESLKERLKQILGNEFEESSIPVNIEKHGLKITGFICKPTYNKANSLYQYLFVNDRPVKDKLLLAGVRAGYMDVLERGRFPVLALFIEIDPTEVDVNVHPAKTEVRFRDANLVKNILVSSIRQIIAEEEANATSSDIRSYLQKQVESSNSEINTVKNINSENHNFSQLSGDFKRISSPLTNHSFKKSFSMPNSVQESSFNNFNQNNETNISEEESFPLGTAMGNICNNYIISKTSEELLVIDQHACHERIVYEKLKKEMLNREIKRQPLLIPEVISLPQTQLESLLDQKDELYKLGLLIEKFGTNEIAVQETPAILGDFNITKTIKDLAEEAEEFSRTESLEDKLNHFIKTYACHTSIRAGKKLSLEEMNSLLRQMEDTPNSGQCNHGRPTFVKLSLNDLEKLFGRK